ncbi:MAG TPA: thioredoxin domain-containing protein [Alphaproteobacteria bacterium]|nr:thioredoxin domain-containing protein [Alphaproteobacteria bacterium]
MQVKGGIAIIVVLLLIGAGFFFMQNKAATTTAEQTPAVTAPMEAVAEAETETSETIAAADTNTEPRAWNATALEPAAGEDGAVAEDTTAPEEEATSATETTADEKAEATPAAAESGSLLAAPKSLEIDVQDAMLDRVLGNLDAPITIIEYASMTCGHCAHFHNTMLPDVKRELLATGKAKLVFRDYPLDKYAMMAGMMARCAPEGKYFDLVEVIFRNQERWMKSDNPLQALAKLGNLAGMDDEYIAACMQNEELRSAIAAGQMEATRLYRVRSTPSFVFNTKKNDNVQSLSGVESAREIIDTANKLINMR